MVLVLLLLLSLDWCCKSVRSYATVRPESPPPMIRMARGDDNVVWGNAAADVGMFKFLKII